LICPLCRESGPDVGAALCGDCTDAVLSLGCAMPPCTATAEEVRAWAAANQVGVHVCRREAPEARLHRAMLDVALDALVKSEDDWPEAKQDWFATSLRAFEDVRERGVFPLSDKQLAWVEKVADALGVDLPRADRGRPIPRGRPVALAVDAMPKPLRPPGRL